MRTEDTKQRIGLDTVGSVGAWLAQCNVETGSSLSDFKQPCLTEMIVSGFSGSLKNKMFQISKTNLNSILPDRFGKVHKITQSV